MSDRLSGLYSRMSEDQLPVYTSEVVGADGINSAAPHTVVCWIGRALEAEQNEVSRRNVSCYLHTRRKGTAHPRVDEEKRLAELEEAVRDGTLFSSSCSESSLSFIF